MKRTLEKNRQKVTKGITQATTLGHVNLIPFKFRFELSSIKLTGLKLQKGTVVFVWERRDKLLSTAEADIVKGTVGFNDVLVLDCTLFRKPDEDEFSEKKAKMALRIGNKEGKTVAKIHVDLAKYARVPSGTENCTFKLTDGSKLSAKCTSTLTKSGRSKNKSQSGSSAAFSVFTTGSGGLSKGGDFDDLADLDDLNDLGLDDDDGLDLALGSKPVVAKKTERAGSPTAATPPGRPFASPVSSETSFTSSSRDPVVASKSPEKPRKVLGTLLSKDSKEAKRPLLGMFGTKGSGKPEEAGAEIGRRIAQLEQEGARLQETADQAAQEVAMLKLELDKSLANVVQRKKARARNEEVESALSGTLTSLTKKLQRLRLENDHLEGMNATNSEDLAVLRAENDRLENEEELDPELMDIAARNEQLRGDIALAQKQLVLCRTDELLVNELKTLKLQLAVANDEKEEALRRLRAFKGSQR